MSSQFKPIQLFQKVQTLAAWALPIMLTGVTLAGVCWLALQAEDAVYYRFRLWDAQLQHHALAHFAPSTLTPGWLPWLMLGLAFGSVFTLRIKLKSIEKSLLYTAGSMIIYVWLAFMAYTHGGIRLGVAMPLTGMGLAVLAGSMFLAVQGDQQVRLLEGHLSRLVSKDVFSEIRKRREVIGREGQHLEITSMVVDLREFTPWAENRSPQEVTELLNRFYAVVVETVFAYRGTIDKFMGDGILVIFGAPIADAEHRQKALSCAQALVDRMHELPLQLGVSLHSGPAFVGFIGPSDKLEYTAIGDTVNLCSRLQQEAKTFQTPLIVSETVLPPEPVFKKLATIQVRGRDQQIGIYALTDVPE